MLGLALGGKAFLPHFIIFPTHTLILLKLSLDVFRDGSANDLDLIHVVVHRAKVGKFALERFAEAKSSACSWFLSNHKQGCT